MSEERPAGHFYFGRREDQRNTPNRSPESLHGDGYIEVYSQTADEASRPESNI